MELALLLGGPNHGETRSIPDPSFEGPPACFRVAKPIGFSVVDNRYGNAEQELTQATETYRLCVVGNPVSIYVYGYSIPKDREALTSWRLG